MNWAEQTVAVTGATGFLGSHITLELLRRGAQVRGVVRTPSKGAWLEEHGATMARADLGDEDSLAEAFAGCTAVVSNAALFKMGRASWEDYYLPNMTGTRNVYSAIERAGVKRVVQISTVGVYKMRLGGSPDESAARLTEADRRGSWAYYITKAMSEDAAWQASKDQGLDLTVIRPGPIYGPRDRNMTPVFRKLMRLPICPAPTFRLPSVHAGDVAIAVAGALANPDSAGKAYNTAGDPQSIRRFLKAWKEITGRGPLLLPMWIPGGVSYDSSAAKRDLGFTNRSYLDGLRDTLA